MSEVGVEALAWTEVGTLVPHWPARLVPVTVYDVPLAVMVLACAQQHFVWSQPLAMV